jgi:PST family polysaccharide transporter
MSNEPPVASPVSSRSDLAALVRRGTGAVVVAQIGSQVVSLVVLGCLARLVPAAAFGVMAVVMPLVMLPRMAATLGLGTAAIQRHDADHALLSGLFWRSIAWSLVAALVTAAGGPLLAWLFQAPEITFVAVAMALGTVLNGLSVVPLASLERELKMRGASLARLASQTVAGIIAVGMAWWGWEVWSLVWQHVAELVLLAGLAWLFCSWRPSLRHWHVPAETKQFGTFYALSTLLVYAAQNADKLLLAAWLGSSPRAQALVGMYAQAFNLMMRPVYVITVPINSLLLPTLSRVQHDRAAKAGWTEHFYRLAALALLPAGVGLWVVSNEVMQVLAPHWPEAGGLLAALAPVIIAQGFINMAGMLLASVGRTGLLAFGGLVQLVLLVQGVAFGAWIGTRLPSESFDPVAQQAFSAAVAVSLVTTLVILVPYLVFVFTIADVPLRRLGQAVRIALPAAFLMGAVVYMERQWLLSHELPALARLVVCVLTGAVAYGFLTLREWRPLLFGDSK